MRQTALQTLVIASILFITACSFNKTLDGLSSGILNQDDPELVQEGLPTLLLVLDGLLESRPESTDLLRSTSRLYASYASTFVNSPTRGQRLVQKARRYSQKALCLELEQICNSLDKPLDEFETALNSVAEKQASKLYDFNVVWVTWIQLNSDDWSAIAEIPKAEAIFNKIAQWDEAYDNGGLQLYLGVLASQLPPSFGGKPEKGRQHFEKAIQYSNGKNLMVKVLYAEHYARLVFNKTLHDRLLTEVINADSNAPNLTLINTLAKKQAHTLLDSSEDYF